jgi:hypothetical protein
VRRRTALAGVGLAIAATMSIAAPAAAQELCFGPSAAYLCVDPTGGDPIEECIYAGPPPCHPVSVPTPSMRCGGLLVFFCIST